MEPTTLTAAAIRVSAMKKFILAGAAVLSLGVGSAFANPTIVYTNGSTYDSTTGVTSPPPTAYAMGDTHTKTDAQPWQNDKPQVIRFGPPTGGLGGR
jgi:hypothetical protein